MLNGFRFYALQDFQAKRGGRVELGPVNGMLVKIIEPACMLIPLLCICPLSTLAAASCSRPLHLIVHEQLDSHCRT